MTEMINLSEFVEGFFGPGNDAWPDRDPDSPTGRRIQTWLEPLRRGTDHPVILPRGVQQENRWDAYVLTWSATQATAVAELLTAFVGPTWSNFDGIPHRLNPADPVERAIQEVHCNRVFLLRVPRSVSTQAWKALARLRECLKMQPARTLNQHRPVGRLLSDLDVALAAGDVSTAQALLDLVTATGALDPLNIAFLRIQFLSRLGRGAELLHLPRLRDVADADPPLLVRDAVLASLFTLAVEPAIAENDLPRCAELVANHGEGLQSLLGGAVTQLGDQALIAAAALSWVSHDEAALRRIIGTAEILTTVDGTWPALATAVQDFLAERPGDPSASDPDQEWTDASILPAGRSRVEALLAAAMSADRLSWLRQAVTEWHQLPADMQPMLPESLRAVVDEIAPEESPSEQSSWVGWAEQLVNSALPVRHPLAPDSWRAWGSPTEVDAELAAVIGDAAGGASVDNVWAMAGPLIEADELARPAGKTALELLNNALICERFAPGDLVGIAALVDMVIRSSPLSGSYEQMLDDLLSHVSRWVSPAHPNPALDMLDSLIMGPCPDQKHREQFAVGTLSALAQHAYRLGAGTHRFAQQLSEELGAATAWPAQGHPDERDDDGSLDFEGKTVLLYSLDDRVLKRVAQHLGDLCPRLTVHVSNDRVGSSRLREQARHSDVVVLATRCATHAATGFIQRHRQSRAELVYADGSGSGSMIHATHEGFTRLSGPSAGADTRR
jgi:hypothetical protein